MKEGRLSYNYEEDRFGLLVDNAWYHPGLHCGEQLEVWTDGKWVPTRIEIDINDCWYLVDTPFIGNRMEQLIARL